MNNAVRDGDGRTIGYRCFECDKIAQSMWGTVCNECRAKERRHQETLDVNRKLANLDLRTKLMQVIVGMAKEAGYDLERFILETRTAWPHVPVTTRCPLGMESTPDLCSAGYCTTCAKREVHRS